MQRKATCYLTTVHLAFDDHIFHKEVKMLVQAGYDVTLIAPNDKDEVVEGVKIVALPKPRNRFQRIFVLTWRVFYLSLRQQADIYHFHDPELVPIGFLLKIFRKKVIYDVHEDVPKSIISTKYYIPITIRPFIAFIVNIIERRHYRFF